MEGDNDKRRVKGKKVGFVREGGGGGGWGWVGEGNSWLELTRKSLHFINDPAGDLPLPTNTPHGSIPSSSAFH